MHSYHKKLLPNHFDDYFIPISLNQSHSTRLSILTTCFYLELTLPQENVLLQHLLALKFGLQYQAILSLQLLLPSNGNLRNAFYMKKISNYEM